MTNDLTEDVSQPASPRTPSRQFVLQMCQSCGSYQGPAHLNCERCGSADFVLSSPSGEGVVYSYAVLHRTSAADWQDALPFTVVQIELAEGPLIMASVTPETEKVLAIGLRVQAADQDPAPVWPCFELSPKDENP